MGVEFDCTFFQQEGVQPPRESTNFDALNEDLGDHVNLK
jgi:hypothetical protein